MEKDRNRTFVKGNISFERRKPSKKKVMEEGRVLLSPPKERRRTQDKLKDRCEQKKKEYTINRVHFHFQRKNGSNESREEVKLHREEGGGKAHLRRKEGRHIDSNEEVIRWERSLRGFYWKKSGREGKVSKMIKLAQQQQRDSIYGNSKCKSEISPRDEKKKGATRIKERRGDIRFYLRTREGGIEG